MADVYSRQSSLFSKIIQARSIEQLQSIFEGATSTFWITHYTFDKTSKSTPKKLTKPFINLLIVNTIIPIKFAFNKFNRDSNQDDLLEIMQKRRLIL